MSDEIDKYIEAVRCGLAQALSLVEDGEWGHPADAADLVTVMLNHPYRTPTGPRDRSWMVLTYPACRALEAAVDEVYTSAYVLAVDSGPGGREACAVALRHAAALAVKAVMTHSAAVGQPSNK